MTVRCPRCGTLYRRPRRRSGDAYQCAKCRHVFPGSREPTDAAPPDEEPAFVLGDDDADDVTDTDDDGPDELPPPEKKPSRRTEAPAEADAPSGAAPARFALRSLVGVTLCYGAFSIYLVTHADVTRTLLARIPLVGSTLLESRLDPASIQLTNVRGEFERVKGDRLVFVVKGSAVNASPIPVRGIQVEGHLTGAKEERQVVFCGAAPRDVRDLSLREIALLQTLEPPADWAVAPSDQTDFLIVFANPPADLKDYSVEVVGVRAEPRRSGPTTRPLGS